MPPGLAEIRGGRLKKIRQRTVGLPGMLQRSRTTLLNYMKHHNHKTARQYSAEYGKVWTKQITPRTQQDNQLYGWYHNYPYHNQNDLTWWADRRRPRHTVASYALRLTTASVFASLLRSQEGTAIHRLSIGGGTSLLLPTDASFSDPAFLDKLRTSPDECRRFLLRHIVTGEMTMRTLVHRCKESKTGSIAVKTVGGDTIPIRVTGSLEKLNREITFGGAKVVNHGIKCSNGVVFVLDGLV